MGDAKRRKKAMAALSAAVGEISHSVRQVVGATTSGYGADCVAYALTGAEVLRRMGHDARAVAGSAAWRLGPGVGDVISHAVELHGMSTGAFSPAEAERAAMFHAWVEAGGFIVDFTTFALADKARQLDAMDGGKTDVQWRPAYLVAEVASSMTLHAVAAGFRPALYAYVRNTAIEKVVLEGNADFDAGGLADMVQHACKNGGKALVFSVGLDGMQGLDDARLRSMSTGLTPARLEDLLPRAIDGE